MIGHRPAVPDVESDEGLVTAELVLAVAFVFFPLMILMASVAQWPQRQAAAGLAAAEGARAAAMADTAAEAEQAAIDQARSTLAASGVTDGNPSVSVSGVFAPGEHVDVTVAVDLPTIDIRLLPPFAGRRYSVTYHERIDVHRTEP